MASCERCWKQAGGDPEYYRALITQTSCTPEAQAGADARLCPNCDRWTVHQYAGVCMVQGCTPAAPKPDGGK